MVRCRFFANPAWPAIVPTKQLISQRKNDSTLRHSRSGGHPDFLYRFPDSLNHGHEQGATPHGRIDPWELERVRNCHCFLEILISLARPFKRKYDRIKISTFSFKPGGVPWTVS
jgi:hypothetical protein